MGWGEEGERLLGGGVVYGAGHSHHFTLVWVVA